MRYHIRERAWSLTEAFVVRNDHGHPVFEIRGKFFHMGDNLVMFDHQSREELVHIKQRLISLRPTYDIYRQGQHWGSVHEPLSFFGERFKVQGENGMVFHVHGNISNWQFAVRDNQGNLLGEVSRQFSVFRDSYAVDVAPGVDAPFIVALAVVIEMVKEKHEHKG